jgi:predicted DNA-binding protein (MmcQ/YjbR family)
MYALTGLEHEEFRVNLKCDPERAVQLREEHPDHIMAGWHMSKKHWNTVYFERGLDAKLLRELVDHSYDLVMKGLRKKDKEIFDSL